MGRASTSLLIQPYLGYGTPTRISLAGRVLQDEGLPPARATDSRWRNRVSFYRRLESDEVPHARVRARFRGRTTEVVTDGEGYFQLDLRPPRPLRGGAWHDVALSLVEPAAPAFANGRVLVPAAGARFGVISDVDDTVMVSGVTRRLAMVVRLALSNARTRKPFAGVAAFYRALHADRNPIFYVSKSPWNLYEPLVQFFETQGLPLGPLLLRDYGGRMLLGAGRDHKRVAIDRILRTYPRLPSVLIGDSGQEARRPVDWAEGDASMSECKHGLRSGCAYCHAPRQSSPPPRQAAAGQPKKRASSASLSEKMNDRMTALKKRLREIRGS